MKIQAHRQLNWIRGEGAQIQSQVTILGAFIRYISASIGRTIFAKTVLFDSHANEK